MKILFLTRRFWPEIGGVERHVLEVSKELVKRGHEVTIVSEDDGSFSKSLLADRSTMVGLQGETFGTIRTHKIPVGASEKLKKFLIWGWLWNNRKLIEEADLVHAHDVGFWYWPFRFFYPKKPFFMTFHGWEEKFPVPLKNKLQRKISEKMAKGNICVGEYLTKWYGTRADYVTYGGVVIPTPRGSTSHTPEVSLPPATFEVGPRETIELLFIGRLEKGTGITMYLKALRLLRKDKKDFQLTICGDGPLREKAEQYVEENNMVVSFLGEVGDLGVLGDLREKARFIFTSGYLSILEAMAEKKLVFSVYSNSLKEDYLRLGKLGKLAIICGSEKELAEKIKFYLENPAKEKEMTDLAYNWVKGETWGKVTEMYLKLYEN